MLENIFTTPLYAVDLQCDLPSMTATCLSLQSKDSGVLKSNAGGWHSSNLDDSFLPVIQKSILYYSNAFSKQCGLKGTRTLSSLWCNINSYKDYNKAHRHPESCLSGVFYIQTPANCGRLCFVRESSALIDAYWDRYTDSYNTHTSREFGVPPRAGMLLLFPSWCEHFVEPNLSKEKRISLSFNLQ